MRNLPAGMRTSFIPIELSNPLVGHLLLGMGAGAAVASQARAGRRQNAVPRVALLMAEAPRGTLGDGLILVGRRRHVKRTDLAANLALRAAADILQLLSPADGGRHGPAPCASEDRQGSGGRTPGPAGRPQ